MFIKALWPKTIVLFVFWVVLFQFINVLQVLIFSVSSPLAKTLFTCLYLLFGVKAGYLHSTWLERYRFNCLAVSLQMRGLVKVDISRLIKDFGTIDRELVAYGIPFIKILGFFEKEYFVPENDLHLIYQKLAK